MRRGRFIFIVSLLLFHENLNRDKPITIGDKIVIKSIQSNVPLNFIPILYICLLSIIGNLNRDKIVIIRAGSHKEFLGVSIVLLLFQIRLHMSIGGLLKLLGIWQNPIQSNVISSRLEYKPTRQPNKSLQFNLSNEFVSSTSWWLDITNLSKPIKIVKCYWTTWSNKMIGIGTHWCPYSKLLIKKLIN